MNYQLNDIPLFSVYTVPASEYTNAEGGNIMIRITLQYGANTRKLLVPEMKKLRDVLTEADIAFSPEDHLIIGDRTLSGDELEKTSSTWAWRVLPN